MKAFPGTVETSRSFSGETNYVYRVCSEITNPAGRVRIGMSQMEFIPVGADGTSYPPQGLFGGYSIDPGTTSSQCWSFQEFNSTHGPAATYRLRFTYYGAETPALLSVEASSNLSLITSRF